MPSFPPTAQNVLTKEALPSLQLQLLIGSYSHDDYTGHNDNSVWAQLVRQQVGSIAIPPSFIFRQLTFESRWLSRPSHVKQHWNKSETKLCFVSADHCQLCFDSAPLTCETKHWNKSEIDSASWPSSLSAVIWDEVTFPKAVRIQHLQPANDRIEKQWH